VVLGVRSRADAWVVAVVAAGGATAAFALTRSPPVTTATLALLVVAVIFTELMQVTNEFPRTDPLEAHAFSFSSGVHVAAAILAGPWTAALVAASGVVLVDSTRGERPRVVAYNASVFALATAGGGLVFQVLGGHPGSLALPADLPRVAALTTTAFLVNTLLIGTIIALSRGVALVPLQLEKLRAELPSLAGEAGLGLALAVLVAREPWAIVALVPLVFGVYQAHARLVDLRRETKRALETFANVVDERDPSTYRHSARVAELVGDVAQSLRLPAAQVARLRWAGRLHDLGKVAVDGDALRRPGELTDAEWTAMRRHPRISARFVRRFRFARAEASAIEYHHERYDGGGYYSASPEDVPLAAHFLVVADSYDAMVSDRPYRRGRPRGEALGEIERGAGTQFHPAVAKAFVARQRGVDPLAVLTRAEREELGRAGKGAASPLASAWTFVRQPVALPVAGAIVAVAGVGLGSIAIVAVGTIGFVCAVGLRGLQRVRARRLARSLAAAIAAASPASALDAVAAVLDGEAGLRWAAVVDWTENELEGRVERSWGGPASAPSEVALTSWLAREADTAGSILVAHRGLPERGVDLAVPVRDGDDVRAYLVLRFARLPRHVETAVEDSASTLAAPFARHRVRPTARLAAVG
jgi:putative nucleotidyltransferase with HDIG domain